MAIDIPWVQKGFCHGHSACICEVRGRPNQGMHHQVALIQQVLVLAAKPRSRAGEKTGGFLSHGISLTFINHGDI